MVFPALATSAALALVLAAAPAPSRAEPMKDALTALRTTHPQISAAKQL